MWGKVSGKKHCLLGDFSGEGGRGGGKGVGKVSQGSCAHKRAHGKCS